LIKLIFISLLLISNSIFAAGFYISEIGTPGSLGTAGVANPVSADEVLPKSNSQETVDVLRDVDIVFNQDYESLIVAAAETNDTGESNVSSSNDNENDDVSAECLKFKADHDADVGDVLRAGCQPSTAQMAKLMDNPLGNVAMMLNQYDIIRLRNSANGKEKNQGNFMSILQFPLNLSENWNIINRVVFNVPSSPIDQDKVDRLGTSPPQSGPPPPLGTPPALIDAIGGRTDGFGDMYYVALFSPKKPIEYDNLAGKGVWGVGFDLGFPTASEDVLGSDKWTAGPSALYAYLGPKWKVGGLVQQYFDYAGPSDAGDVNLTNLQYLYYYSLSPTLSVGAAPNIIVDWEQSSGNRLTLPIGLGVNKTINIGKVPVRFAVEFHYSVIRPDDIPGADWNLRFNIIPAAPSALFRWMNKQIF